MSHTKDRLNNKLSNLRLVTQSENCFNRNNRYGEASPRYFTRHRNGMWQVIVKDKYIGIFQTKALAISAVEKESA